MDEIQKDKDLDLLERHTKQLMEHFDTVQIFCTKHNGGEDRTVTAHFGNGNWFARYGQIELWLQDQTLTGEKENEL